MSSFQMMLRACSNGILVTSPRAQTCFGLISLHNIRVEDNYVDPGPNIHNLFPLNEFLKTATVRIQDCNRFMRVFVSVHTQRITQTASVLWPVTPAQVYHKYRTVSNFKQIFKFLYFGKIFKHSFSETGPIHSCRIGQVTRIQYTSF